MHSCLCGDMTREPRRSRDEVAEIRAMVQELTHDNEMLRGQIEKAQARLLPPGLLHRRERC